VAFHARDGRLRGRKRNNRLAVIHSILVYGVQLFASRLASLSRLFDLLTAPGRSKLPEASRLSLPGRFSSRKHAHDFPFLLQDRFAEAETDESHSVSRKGKAGEKQANAAGILGFIG